ncbi:MAG: spore coat protein, partial [Pseudomonadota bacterium]
YHYHDPKLPSSLWHYVPWDLNQSFGQDWRTERSAPQSTQPEGYYVYMNGLFERILDDDNLGPALRARYGTELAGPYAVEPLLALFDGMVQEVAASAQRDETKWSATYRSYNGWNTRSDFTTFEQEAQYMRRWIVDRHAYLDSLY